MRWRRTLSQAVLGGGYVLFAAACGGNGNSAESTPAPTAGTATAVAPIATTQTATPAVTSPSTAVAAAPTTSAAVVTETALATGIRASELFVSWASGVIAIHDADTGRLIRVVTTTGTDGEFLLDPVSSPDGTTYMSTSVEDSWYSCDASIGTVIALTAKGETSTVGPGGAPVVSADGTHLAYVRSSECRPDPAQPDLFVIVDFDTVVVRDLATGEERSWTFPGAFDNTPTSTVVSSLVWYGDSLLVLIDGRLVRLDTRDPAVPAPASGMAVQLTAGDPREIALLGAKTDGTVLAEVNPHNVDGSTVRIVALDPTTGKEVAEIFAFDQPTFAKVDPSGTRWAGAVNGSLIVDGRETILERPPLPPGVDASFEDSPTSVGW
jgi:hypothetical protein